MNLLVCSECLPSHPTVALIGGEIRITPSPLTNSIGIVLFVD